MKNVEKTKFVSRRVCSSFVSKQLRMTSYNQVVDGSRQTMNSPAKDAARKGGQICFGRLDCWLGADGFVGRAWLGAQLHTFSSCAPAHIA